MVRAFGAEGGWQRKETQPRGLEEQRGRGVHGGGLLGFEQETSCGQADHKELSCRFSPLPLRFLRSRGPSHSLLIQDARRSRL